MHSHGAPGGRQIRPPTMIHVDKMRILENNCLKEKRVAGDRGRMRASTTNTSAPFKSGLRGRTINRQRTHYRQVRQARQTLYRLLP